MAEFNRSHTIPYSRSVVTMELAKFAREATIGLTTLCSKKTCDHVFDDKLN